jgi:transmembrane sensor
MKQDDDKIDYLLAGKAAETLNSEELIEINTLISEDTSIQERWQSLMNALPASGLPQVNWADLSTIVQKPKRKLLLLKKLAAAAVLTGICVTSYLYFPKTQKQVVANNTIQLKLANGQVIDLGKEKGSLAAGDAQLSNTQHTLTYTVNGKEKPGLNSLTVPVGKDYKITLIDGTEVWLNSASQLSFPFAFAGNTREISINGEAYLKIAPDATKPFIVHLPHNKVQVLGTEFNVNSYDSGVVKVALVQGAVNVINSSSTVAVKPGMEAVSGANGISIEDFDKTRVLGWKKGIYYFYDADLKEISKVLPRWFGIQVSIDNPAVMSKKFAGGVDRNQPIGVFIDNLKMVSDIDCTFDQSSNTLHFQ